jgi:hypothetical protein
MFGAGGAGGGGADMMSMMQGMMGGAGGVPGGADVNRMQQQLLSNPEMMANIMNSPMMQVRVRTLIVLYVYIHCYNAQLAFDAVLCIACMYMYSSVFHKSYSSDCMAQFALVLGEQQHWLQGMHAQQ